jgi:hypothetical protein
MLAKRSKKVIAFVNKGKYLLCCLKQFIGVVGSKRPVVGGGQRSRLNNSLASGVESWPQYPT